jgi:hypothetical protein
VQSDGSSKRVFAARYSASSNTWGAAQVIDASTGYDANTCSIATDSHNNAMCAFGQNDGEKDRIFVTRYNSATGLWEAPEIIDAGPEGIGAFMPVIVFDHNDNAWCLFGHADPDGSLRFRANRYY